MKELTSRKRVNSLKEWAKRLWQYVRGWVQYFKRAQMSAWLKQVDMWMRRRIRMVFWKKWKRVRTRYRNLRRLGLSHDEARKLAGSRKGYWRLAKTPNMSAALPNRRLEAAGFPFFHSYYQPVIS